MSDLIFGMQLGFGISSSPRVLKNNGLLGERVIFWGLAGLSCAIIFAYPHSESGLPDLSLLLVCYLGMLLILHERYLYKYLVLGFCGAVAALCIGAGFVYLSSLLPLPALSAAHNSQQQLVHYMSGVAANYPFFILLISVLTAEFLRLWLLRVYKPELAAHEVLYFGLGWGVLDLCYKTLPALFLYLNYRVDREPQMAGYVAFESCPQAISYLIAAGMIVLMHVVNTRFMYLGFEDKRKAYSYLPFVIHFAVGLLSMFGISSDYAILINSISEAYYNA
ncbi:hypothetical protein [Bartonella tribocorum]|uniref:Uncharacterized protein n=1 Tax=Bartonella tribocorum (strain DSM 28219 / CCUG 45778 / CIP 105476 / IBS 506) TaxID=382640 RepID=A9IQ91_BART1|nr:hypothetical protein [Bartonella tribocorum]CAK01027.1 hypothetical protein predicted by Glimmer/Critica [Bartonella tribocorum CIP 105476]CDO48233.1 putative integral membrane protein [Bartonella tribocorum]